MRQDEERTVVINSLSKEFCMTGWRLGYVAAPSELISVMTMFQENIAACAPLPSQYAAIEALRNSEKYSAGMMRNSLSAEMFYWKKLPKSKQ